MIRLTSSFPFELGVDPLPEAADLGRRLERLAELPVNVVPE